MIAVIQSIRALVVTGLAFLSSYVIGWQAAGWIVFIAILFIQLKPTLFFWRDCVGMLALSILLTMSVSVVFYIENHFFWLACFLSLVTLLSVYLNYSKSTLFVIVIPIISMISVMLPPFLFVRASYIFVGVGLALITKLTIMPPNRLRESRREQAVYLNSLNEYQKYLFWLYVSRNYTKNHFFYEKQLHIQRVKAMNCLENFRMLEVKNIDAFEKLFEVMLSLGDMRYRIKDFSIFEMSEKELISISNALSILLKQIEINSKSSVDFSTLETAIELLEDLNRNTLQIAVADPLAFTIFIQYLRSLIIELKQIC